MIYILPQQQPFNIKTKFGIENEMKESGIVPSFPSP